MLKKRQRSFVTVLSIIIIVIFAFLINKFILNRKIELKSETGGNINVLLLGKGGGKHEGPDLTDTMILASLNPKENEAILISIPRDLWIPDIKGKINLAYSIGQGKNKQGILLSKAVVEKVTGENIDYTVVIDFSGFVKVIDFLGGIDVNVSHTLDDYAYPIEGKEEESCDHTDQEIVDLSAQIATSSAKEWEAFPCRYKHLHVPAGPVHMNGEQALEFSRSRHGVGPEGTDFARSRRQQEVISAVRSKVLSLGTILNPIRIIGIFNIIKDNIDTNIQLAEADDFIKLAQQMQRAKIKSYVIDFGDETEGRFGLLVEPLPSRDKGFQSILIPRRGEGNYSEIQEFVDCLNKDYICTIERNGIKKGIN